MAWFSRITRFGDVHMVFGQEQEISCGVACVIMCAFKVNKLTPGVRAAFSEADVLAKATEIFGSNPLGTAGLDNPMMVQLLNDPLFNMPGWALRTVTRSHVPNRIINYVGVTEGLGPTIDVKPLIVGLDWNGGGGHWVVVDTIRRGLTGGLYATVCDPYDANVHVTPVARNTTFDYTGQQVTGVDFWGTHLAYETPSVGGAFVGDLIRRRVSH